MEPSLIPQEYIERKIYYFRGKKIMLDEDLATLYDVEVRTLNQAVKRNSDRFPEDFSFQLTEEEFESLRSQIVISNVGRGGRRYLPIVFTEQGVAMLSGVLKSKRAIHVNVQIMRTFTKLREMLLENEALRYKIELMEKQYDEQFRIVFDTMRRLLDNESVIDPPIGFQDNRD